MKMVDLILPILILSSSRLGEAHPLQEKAVNQSTTPYVADYYQLAREYGEEIARRHNTYLNWIDFDASQPYTRNWCRELGYDSCKITMYPRNFRLREVKETWPSEKIVFQQTHINNGSGSDEVSFSEEIGYKDSYTSTTTNAFHLGSSIRAEGKVDFLFGSEKISVGVDFAWDTSNTNSEKHVSEKKFKVLEKFSLPPNSKTDITMLIKEGNYDVDFSADIVIDGHFVYAFGKNVEIAPGSGRWATYWFFKDYHLPYIARRHGSPYIKKLAEGYSYAWNDNEWVIKYEAKGELKGVYGYKVDSRERKHAPTWMSICKKNWHRSRNSKFTSYGWLSRSKILTTKKLSNNT